MNGKTKVRVTRSMIEVIKQRTSVRNYTGLPIEAAKQKRLTDFVVSNIEGPFGARARFLLLDLDETERSEVSSLSTYGVIQHARLFILGTVQKHPQAMEDFGYCMEKNVLEATSLGLGTCWLGGTFSRGGFAEKIGLTEEELLPAITPVGYAAGKKTILEKMFRLFAGSKTRKSWGELFFEGDLTTPLAKKAAGKYADVLECIRLAPSASNKQPWRLIKGTVGDTYHFFLKRTPGYDKLFGEIKLQNIDMGIAMCHFELAATELGLHGHWSVAKPELDTGDMEYIATWHSLFGYPYSPVDEIASTDA